MAERGDLEGAIHHAQKCRKIRERIFGLLDVRVMESCRQTARMVLAPFKEYSGVLTPQIKQSYREAIQCHEKVFRFLQQQKSRLRKANTLRKRQSVRSMVSMKTENEPPIKETVPHSYCGPLVISPFGWAPPLNSSMLHKLTKEIVSMKLSLVELPKHRDCIRQFRARRELQAKERENGNETVGAFAFDEEDARSAILRMAAVTPSVYLDDILHRIEQDDQGAINELGLVMTLTESETVGVIV